MKMVIVLGSPRKGGNGETLALKIAEAVEQDGNTVEYIRLNDLNLRPCQGCGGCDKTGICVVKDDMTDILQQDAPWIWGYHRVAFGLYHSWMQNVKSNAMANNTIKYKSIDVVERNASREMSQLFGAQTKFGTWRQLWLELARAQKKLGLDIKQTQIDEMAKHLDDIYFEKAARY